MEVYYGKEVTVGDGATCDAPLSNNNDKHMPNDAILAAVPLTPPAAAKRNSNARPTAKFRKIVSGHY